LVTAAVEVGVPYARILDYTQREEVDLVVLGATGWGDAALRLGENAGRVTRYSGCCVLVVR
jgi:nucleotide-binding universal stress UspA family protein